MNNIYIITGNRNWLLIAERNPTRKQFAEKLPEVMRGARAPNTVRINETAWKKWIKWDSGFKDICVCPADA